MLVPVERESRFRTALLSQILGSTACVGRMESHNKSLARLQGDNKIGAQSRNFIVIYYFNTNTKNYHIVVVTPISAMYTCAKLRKKCSSVKFYIKKIFEY